MADCVKEKWRSAYNRREVIKALSEYSEIIFFDVETTGFNAETDRIIEIGAIRFKMSDSNSLIKLDTLHEFIQPPFPISSEITELTGITNEQLSECPKEDDVFEKIMSFFGSDPDVVCAHNTPFDMRFLKALYFRNNCKTIIPRYELDTLEMARELVTSMEAENHKLVTLAKVFSLGKGLPAHSAIGDTQKTAELFEILYKRYLNIDKAKSVAGKRKAIISSINFWPGYRGFSRIYVQTDMGCVYFEPRTSAWYPKDADISRIDMEWVEREAIRLTESDNLKQFAKYSGRLVAN